MRPARGPAGKGGMGDRVNPIPLQRGLTDVRPRVDGFLGVPGKAFGAPFELFGLPWGDLGAHFGAQSRHKRGKKSVSGAHCVPESILSVKEQGQRLV